MTGEGRMERTTLKRETEIGGSDSQRQLGALQTRKAPRYILIVETPSTRRENPGAGLRLLPSAFNHQGLTTTPCHVRSPVCRRAQQEVLDTAPRWSRDVPIARTEKCPEGRDPARITHHISDEKPPPKRRTFLCGKFVDLLPYGVGTNTSLRGWNVTVPSSNP
ncbi:hypothetical protein C0Q70_08373 [Pomacea canaliculata]|uniref:Uncharacterized protein n=1 Tax=Pomacea canaliculata TaxID=400727 RepID=A0A2T7PHM7_POMCA|nr:hypothetical protein C0Q70_08373 [Pomacea canaliculata]